MMKTESFSFKFEFQEKSVGYLGLFLFFFFSFAFLLFFPLLLFLICALTILKHVILLVAWQAHNVDALYFLALFLLLSSQRT